MAIAAGRACGYAIGSTTLPSLEESQGFCPPPPPPASAPTSALLEGVQISKRIPLSTIPLQVFAAEVAQARGYDVDKPRNLAKSVTVE